LDFNLNPRPSLHCKHSIIIIRIVKTVEERVKWAILSHALLLRLEEYTYNEKIQIGEALTKVECYLAGYHVHLGGRTFIKWWYRFLNSRKQNVVVSEIYQPQKKRKISYISNLESRFPGFLIKLFRYATSVLGTDACKCYIYNLMNEKAKLDFQHKCKFRGTLTLTKHHFDVFFNQNNGFLKGHLYKPLLSDEHIKKRLKWSKKYKQKVREDDFHYCFLDEKWFYTTSRRTKNKIIPKTIYETEEDAKFNSPKIRSRRFATKVMFMGVVSPPNRRYNHDGKIFLHRISEHSELKRLSHNQKFSNSFIINHAIKKGEWKELCYHNGMSMDELVVHIAEAYLLEDYIKERIVLSYTTHTKTGKTKKVERIRQYEEDDIPIINNNRLIINAEGTERPLTLDDLTLHVEYHPGDSVENDITCDSEFMLKIIEDIGHSIRDSFHWVDPDVPIHLFMDNAGGHGSDEAKKEYVSILFNKFNILVIWQIPNSPETNMLDLGVWRTIQAMVEYLHRQRRMDTDVLALSVEEAFKKLDGYDKLEAVAERWIKVLDLIILGKGTNDKVEQFRGRDALLIPSALIPIQLTSEYDDIHV
jgi:hypothetical protein